MAASRLMASTQPGQKNYLASFRMWPQETAIADAEASPCRTLARSTQTREFFEAPSGTGSGLAKDWLNAAIA